MQAREAAFAKLIDYAGLFPPAGLATDETVRRYAEYRRGPDRWLLGRLVLPADQLDVAARFAEKEGATPEEPWPVTVLVGGVDDIDTARQRVTIHRQGTCLRVEAIEAAATRPTDIDTLATSWPPDTERYVEIPADPDPSGLLKTIGQAGFGAKIRMGGLTADKIPPAASVARFLSLAREVRVPVKATAGLHHALRGEYALTYEPGSPRATLHGFVNLTFAAALIAARKIDDDTAAALLDDDRPEVFKFGGRAASWLNAVLTYSELAHARSTLLRAVGSCSFDEPAEELKRW